MNPLKTYVIEEVKFFFNTGFTGDEFIFSPRYKTSVLDKNKSVLAASLLWLKEQEAISETDIDSFEDLRKYRNKLAHKMIDLLFEGSFDDFPQNLAALINLRVKIEKWWVLKFRRTRIFMLRMTSQRTTFRHHPKFFTK